MRRNFYLPWHRSTQSAWKQCGARHARRNRVTRTVAERFAQSTSEWPKTLPRGFKGPPIGAPPKPNVSGFGGERRSSGTTELLPLKAKRRMWSLRRRDGPKSRKMHYGEFVGLTHVSPPNPRIKARIQRAALGQGPRQSPTKWVWWGEEEQRND